jgi:hypothetical protein
MKHGHVLKVLKKQSAIIVLNSAYLVPALISEETQLHFLVLNIG